MLALLPAFFACTETVEPDTSSFGYDFFPQEVGFYRTYDVSEIIFGALSTPDTSIYQLKEVYSDSIVSNSQEVSYVLQRWKRSDANAPWELDSIWTSYRNDIQAVVYENNIPLLKLVFPFEEEKKWDSNSFNSRNTDEFQMVDLFSPLNEFESTVKIIHEEKLDSLISLDNRYEMFARNVGLIEKVDSRLDFCQEGDCFGQKIIEEGRIYTQVLTGYGEE